MLNRLTITLPAPGASRKKRSVSGRSRKKKERLLERSRGKNSSNRKNSAGKSKKLLRLR